MIDININAILSQALAATVQQATAPLLERIAALENQALVEHDAVDARIAALENNPAQGVDTTLEQRIAALEQRIAALEAAEQPLTTFTMDALLERLDNQEWFWEKIRRFADGVVESAVAQHCEEYAHDDYDRVVSALEGVDLDDYVTKDSFRDEIEDVLNNATIRIRF